MADGFDIRFDKQLPEHDRHALRQFVRWVEANYEMPIPL